MHVFQCDGGSVLYGTIHEKAFSVALTDGMGFGNREGQMRSKR